MSSSKKIHDHLIHHRKTLAIAESCTGGHLSSQFTQHPGASNYFLGGLIAYSNELKHKWLHVSNDTLIKNGAVSRETADEMLLGLMKTTDADYGIAVTGIAGPTGGTEEKPVGTVFIALGERGKKPHVLKCHFNGDRGQIIESSSLKALEEFARLLI